jgi:DNA-binding NtrC family response regulator/tetratricopeptide (TPR) repeat protein
MARLFAERFFCDDRGAMDLATGEPVRISVAELDACGERARDALCSALADLRHPILVPLLDYGVAHGRWFEAHPAVPRLRASPIQAGRAARHLGRFLLAADIRMSGEDCDRNVRGSTPGGPSAWRPVGVRLRQRSAFDRVITLFEGPAPPGVLRAEICAPSGAGLRTLCTQVARAARLAGLLPIDRRLAESRADVAEVCCTRHLCLIDWQNERDPPRVLAAAADRGARRHVWLRFRRIIERARPPLLVLEPFSTPELMAMIFVDEELGPSELEMRAAALLADGRAGPFIDALSRLGRTRPTPQVHEVAPEYVALPAPEPRTGAGVARLDRVVVAALALARRGRHTRAEHVLRRASEGLAARHATVRAAEAACALGELQIGRLRPEDALAAFARARAWCSTGAITTRSLIGSGRAMLDQGRLQEAEAVLRTALAGAIDDATTWDARELLAETVAVRGDVDRAIDLLVFNDCRAPASAYALASEIERRRGRIDAAGRLAAEAVGACSTDDHRSRALAHLAAMQVQTVLRNAPDVERHARLAATAARASRLPQLVLRAAAESCACLTICGVAVAHTRRERLMAAAERLPALRRAQIRAAVAGIDEHVRRIAMDTGALSLVEDAQASGHHVDALERMLDVTYDAPDEGAALRTIADHVLRSLHACSVTIRCAHAQRQVAAVGRAWPSDASLASGVLESGSGLYRDGITPEAAEPVRAGGVTVGCIAARWLTGASSSPARTREALRLAAAVAAPLLRSFNTSPPAPAGPHPDDLLGPGPAAESVRAAIKRAAFAPYPVLIEGESGAGKELAARAIHARSHRRSRRFCAVNCAALTEDLLEAELFGHARGAFTGALAERAGLFEEADQGTLFLDEVGELSPRAQAKLLRVLQEGEVRRVGENHSRKVDVRIVAATNRSLAAEVEAGRFRADLRFRIDVIRIRIPPLRERPDEVPWLAETMWADAARRVGTKASLAPDLVSALARYDWPGNVRELQNVIASLAVHAPPRGRVSAALLPAHVAGIVGRGISSFDEARVDFERRYLRAALARTGGRRSAAARQLGLSRQGLAKMMKRLGIE